MERELEAELTAREKDFATDDTICSRHSDEFKLLAAAREIRLPAPLDVSRLKALSAGTVWTVASDDLDGAATGMTCAEMQQHMQDNSGIQLIVIKKSVAKEAAYQQYPFIVNSKLPLMAWAKIPASKNIHSVAHLAVLVDASLNKPVFDELLEPQQPSFRDIAAMLNVAISTNHSGM
ncbi:hypothetical protein MMC16_007914, partial [Acarospora aff. strigata]|nr:hypothetical protein [Acarospora aff. strigata]